jgi:O-antigen/teichoic acid export membrane protein
VSTLSADVLLPEAHTDRLHHSTFALLISNGTGVVLGVAFWAVAARLYTKQFVGYGAAEINAMTLLASFALLNLGSVFPRFLYASGSKARVMLRTGYAASTSIALVVSVSFLFITLNHHSYIAGGFFPAAIFVAAVVLWVIFTIEDAALVGFRAAFWVPVENTSFSVVKIALLPVFVVVAPRVGVFTSWVLPVVGCVIVINLYLWRRVMPAHVAHSSGAGVLPQRKVLRTVVLGEYLGGLAFTSMATVPVLMVAARLHAVSAAYFQTPWLAGTSFDALLLSFASALMVEATARPKNAPATVRRTVRLELMILGPSIVAVLVGAPWFLRILGPDYAAHGTRLLQLLALAMPFMAVNVLYVTYGRLARRVRRVFGVQISIAAIVLTLSFVLLTPLGINGPGVAYLSGQGIVALCLLPSVVRQYRRKDMSPGFATGAPLVTRSSGAQGPVDSLVADEPEDDDQAESGAAGNAEVRMQPQGFVDPSDGDAVKRGGERDVHRAGATNPTAHDTES